MGTFLSYSRRDTDFVDLLYRLLMSKGYTVWLDRYSIEAGKRWDNSIQQAIDQSKYLVVILSPEAAGSENVADEWNYAIEQKKTIVPLLYRKCDIPLRLRRFQWINFTERSFDVAFSKLIETLGEPDNRPTDPIELAKREGIIFVDSRSAFGLGGIRIGFDYRDYPQIGSFLSAVYRTLLTGIVEQYTYGVTWLIEDKTTGQRFEPHADQTWDRDLLLHEIGIEPGTQLQIIVLDDEAGLKGNLNQSPLSQKFQLWKKGLDKLHDKERGAISQS